MSTHKLPPLPVATKNAIFRFFRLYMPLSHTRYFTWNRDHDYADSNDCDIGIAICSEKMKDRYKSFENEDRVEEISQKLHSAGFIVKTADLPFTWSESMKVWEHEAEIRLSDALLKSPNSKLKKENGYWEHFTLDDYFIKVLSLFDNMHISPSHEIYSILESAYFSPREKLVAFQKAVFSYAMSSFQKENFKFFLTELLVDLPAIMDIQRDQLKKLTVLESNSTLRQQICAGESERLIKISKLMEKQFPDVKKNRHIAAMAANMVGLFADFISGKDINGPIEVILGFLIKEQMSHPISPTFSFLKSSKENAQYAKKLETLISDIKAYLIEEKMDMRALPDKHLIKMHDQFVSKEKSLTKTHRK